MKIKQYSLSDEKLNFLLIKLMIMNFQSRELDCLCPVKGLQG